MSSGLDRAALEAVVAERSPLTLAQVERMFGGAVTAANKAVVWRFLNMSHNQQSSIWQAFLRLQPTMLDACVEAVT